MPDPVPTTDQAKNYRDRSLRLAVVTSLISKVGTIVLRLVSIPIAIRLLGMESFGVYTAITLAVGLIDMLHIGIGPALTKELSKALARGDRERERTVFGTSILLSAGLTLLAMIGAASLLWIVPIPTLFGPEFAPISEVMYRAAWIGLIIISVEMLCIPFEMGRDGYQETRYNNSWGAAGNVIGALTLLIGIWFFPTIEFLLIAVNGSIALAKLCNTIHLLKQRPYLFPRFALFRVKLVKPILRDGVQFSVTYILAAAVEYNLMAFLIGRYIGPEAVAVFNVMITIHFSLSGIINMVTKPYWPALMDAFERRDSHWIMRSSNLLRLGGLGYSLICGIGLVVFGPIVLPLYAGEQFYDAVSAGFTMDRIALLAFSCYFAAHIWRHMNQILALGVGPVPPVAWVAVAEAVFLVAATATALLQTGNIGVVYLAMTGTIVLFSGWLFPLLFRRGRNSGAELQPMTDPLPTPI